MGISLQNFLESAYVNPIKKHKKKNIKLFNTNQIILVDSWETPLVAVVCCYIHFESEVVIYII